MIAANIESSIGAAVIVAAMLLIRWLGDRFAEKHADSKLAAYRVKKSRMALGVKGDSEEERVRRFLEALGIPADSPEARRASAPPPARRPQRREPPSRQEPPKQKPAASGFPRRQPPPLQTPPPVPGRAEAPPVVEAPVGRVPALHVRTIEVHPENAVHTLQTIPSTVEGTAVATGGGASTAPARQDAEMWREALRSPQALRSAIILQEILGPPRGLQSDKFPHSFPSL